MPFTVVILILSTVAFLSAVSASLAAWDCRRLDRDFRASIRRVEELDFELTQIRSRIAKLAGRVYYDERTANETPEEQPQTPEEIREKLRREHLPGMIKPVKS